METALYLAGKKYVGLPLRVRNKTPRNRLMVQTVATELPSHGAWVLSVSPPSVSPPWCVVPVGGAELGWAGRGLGEAKSSP